MANKVDMKRTDTPKENDVCCSPGSDEKYPWGLRITLDNDSLKKLGITTLPGVGEKICIDSDVTVVSVRSNEEKDGVESSVELQITAMLLCAPDKEEVNHAEVLYGKTTAS